MWFSFASITCCSSEAEQVGIRAGWGINAASEAKYLKCVERKILRSGLRGWFQYRAVGSVGGRRCENIS